MSKKKISEFFDFKGRTAVITGGARGIGYGIAERFAEAGANVAIADIDEAAGVEKAEEIKKEGARCLFVKTDVSLEEDVKNLAAQAVKNFGGIDIFVNNAGIFPHKQVLNMDLEFWEKVQAVNLRGAFLCCREAAKIMARAGKGNIINIASIHALHPSRAGMAAYDASKHGLWGFTKNFALEAAKSGIRVNAIAPGGINTEGVRAMTEKGVKQGVSYDDLVKRFVAEVPLGRFGEPDDIAAATLFLASDASSYITGSIIVVDGGVSL